MSLVEQAKAAEARDKAEQEMQALRDQLQQREHTIAQLQQQSLSLISSSVSSQSTLVSKVVDL